MKLLFDLFPVILFFLAYKAAGIFVATAMAIAATFVQIGWVWWRHRKVDAMLWASLIVITVFGGATLLFHDENFIKWKPTVLYWLVSAALAGSALLFGRNLVRSALSAQLTLPDFIWSRLNVAWSLFFAGMGGLNLYVAYRFPLDVWVNYKLFGTMALMILFMLLQGLLLAKYLDKETH